MATATRFLQRHGRDVTWRKVSQGTDDAYGDPQKSVTTETVRAVVERDTSVRRLSGREGERRVHEADIYVDGSTSVTSEPEGFKDEFVVGGETYSVLQVSEARMGLKRCICERHGA